MSFTPISVLGSRFNSSIILEMVLKPFLMYSCGLKHSPALILNQNPIAKIPSVKTIGIKLGAKNRNALQQFQFTL